MTETSPTQGKTPAPPPRPPKAGIGWLGVTLIVIATMIVTLLAGAVAVRYVLFADQFEPVTLDREEQAALDRKLSSIGVAPTGRTDDAPRDRFAPDADEFDAEGRLRPEPYLGTEGPSEVHFDERELNALIARDPELARRLAIDLSRNLISVKLLVPLPPDFPVMGGQTLRVTAGAQVRQDLGPGGEPRLAVVVTGVSLWGVPLPNAWIGGLRGVDLVEQYGNDPGFWQALAEGIETIRVDEGELIVRLAE